MVARAPLPLATTRTLSFSIRTPNGSWVPKGCIIVTRRLRMTAEGCVAALKPRICAVAEFMMRRDSQTLRAGESFNDSPARSVCESLRIMNSATAQIRGFNAATQPSAVIRRRLVTMMQPFGTHDPFGVRIENDKVRVVANGKGALATIKPDKRRRPLAHPARDVRQRESPLSSFRPNGRKRHLQRCNAAPRFLQITGVQVLERRRRR